jgi:hypothetical protein
MLVDVVESLPVGEDAGATVQDDPAIDGALRSFSTAIESDDSLFRCESPTPRVVGDALCTADFVLNFREKGPETNRQLHLTLVEKLLELLRVAGSAETLAARIWLVPRAGGLALRLRLEARGSSVEQARLRWGLGVAHVQQALLFTSRYLRQQMAQSAN